MTTATTTQPSDDSQLSFLLTNDLGPRGYELDRARGKKTANKLPAIGNFGSPSKGARPPDDAPEPKATPPKDAAKQKEESLAEFVRLNGLEDFLSPEKAPSPPRRRKK